MANGTQNKDIPVDIVPDESIRALKAAQAASETISQHRAGQVAYPFEPGTKTLQAKTLDENKRQFDTDLAYTKQRDARNMAMGRGGNGNSGSSIGGTLSERQSSATGELYGILNNIYNRNYEYGKSGINPGEANYKAGKHPLYYTLNDVLKKPELVEASIAAGADVKSAIDSIIRTKAGVSAEKYFSTGKGKDLADIYYSMFPKNKPDETQDELLELLSGL